MFRRVTGSLSITNTKAAGRHRAAAVSALLVFIVDEWSQPVWRGSDHT